MAANDNLTHKIHMRKIFLLSALVFTAGLTTLQAQVLTHDVIILKDGTQVRGQLEPVSPYGENVVKIKIKDGSVQTFSMDKVDRVVPSQDLSGGKAPKPLKPEESTDESILDQKRISFEEEQQAQFNTDM